MIYNIFSDQLDLFFLICRESQTWLIDRLIDWWMLPSLLISSPSSGFFVAITWSCTCGWSSLFQVSAPHLSTVETLQAAFKCQTQSLRDERLFLTWQKDFTNHTRVSLLRSLPTVQEKLKTSMSLKHKNFLGSQRNPLLSCLSETTCDWISVQRPKCWESLKSGEQIFDIHWSGGRKQTLGS